MFDIYDDAGALLKRLYPDVSQLPKFVLMGQPRQFDLPKYASDDFAVAVPLHDGIKYAYPLMTPGATAVSCLYFEHTHQNLPADLRKEAATRLLEACDHHSLEVTEKVAELATEYQEEEKTASFKTRFPDQGIEGTPWFPLSTAEQVKLATDLYPQIIRKLAPSERREFTLNLQKQASAHGLGMPDTAAQWGGNVLAKGLVLDGVEKRASMMNPQQAELLRGAIDQILVMSPEKVASVFEQLDQELGFDVLWDTKLRDPQAIHGFSEPEVELVKFAEFEMSREHWDAACDAGLLDVFEDDTKRALRQHPEVLDEYTGTPVLQHILDGLESLGIVQGDN